MLVSSKTAINTLQTETERKDTQAEAFFAETNLSCQIYGNLKPKGRQAKETIWINNDQNFWKIENLHNQDIQLSQVQESWRKSHKGTV